MLPEELHVHNSTNSPLHFICSPSDPREYVPLELAEQVFREVAQRRERGADFRDVEQAPGAQGQGLQGTRGGGEYSRRFFRRATGPFEAFPAPGRHRLCTLRLSKSEPPSPDEFRSRDELGLYMSQSFDP